MNGVMVLRCHRCKTKVTRDLDLLRGAQPGDAVLTCDEARCYGMLLPIDVRGRRRLRSAGDGQEPS